MRGTFPFLVVENNMVYYGKINPKTKALVRLLCVEGGLSVQQMVTGITFPSGRFTVV